MFTCITEQIGVGRIVLQKNIHREKNLADHLQSLRHTDLISTKFNSKMVKLYLKTQHSSKLRNLRSPGFVHKGILER